VLPAGTFGASIGDDDDEADGIDKALDA